MKAQRGALESLQERSHRARCPSHTFRFATEIPAHDKTDSDSDSRRVQAFIRNLQLLVPFPGQHTDVSVLRELLLCNGIPEPRSQLAEEVIRAVTIRWAVRLTAHCMGNSEREYLWPLVGRLSEEHEEWRTDLRVFLQNIARFVDSDYVGDARVCRALAIMEQELESRPTLTSVARKLALSPCHLSRLLRRFTRAGFVDLLRTIRMKRAEFLLREHRLSVKEIAFTLGYSGTAAFDRDFRHTHYSSPTRWRVAGVTQLGDS
jgi:AraC-like DNA-binding protein